MGAVFENLTEEELCDLMCGAPEIEGITREEAIGWIRALVKTMHEETIGTLHEPEYKDEVYCALEMAIEALEQEPCDDAISRQAAIKLFLGKVHDEYPMLSDVMIGILESLPPVTPKHRTGHWIEYDDSAEFQCDKCGRVWSMFSNEVNTFLYCPNCGAKMEEQT